MAHFFKNLVRGFKNWPQVNLKNIFCVDETYFKSQGNFVSKSPDCLTRFSIKNGN